MTKNLVFIFSIIFLFTSCSTTTTYLQNDNTIEQNAKKYAITDESKYTKLTSELNKIEKKEFDLELPKTINMNQAFMDFYDEWKNVKYRLGGNSKRGIDCSAFTQRAFKEKFDVKIPRTTRTQVKVGKRIDKSELELGDLVFFKTGKRDRHVGIYMGNGDFLHASIKGVKFTKLDKPYYKKAYWTSRRVIH